MPDRFATTAYDIELRFFISTKAKTFLGDLSVGSPRYYMLCAKYAETRSMMAGQDLRAGNFHIEIGSCHRIKLYVLVFDLNGGGESVLIATASEAKGLNPAAVS